MKPQFESSRFFDRTLKRLSRKHRSLEADIEALRVSLTANPQLGESLGNNCYKIRLAISSKGQGKRGGARVITHVIVAIQPDNPTTIFLLAIYDKAELASLSREEIDALVAELGGSGAA